MFIKLKRKLAGWTLMEMMIGTAVFSIAGTAISTAYVVSLRSFQALSNYSVLDQQNREAVDQITRDIRQANSVIAFDNSLNRKLSVVNGDRTTNTYTFNRYTQQLMCSRNGGAATVLLQNCSLIDFNMGMRPPIGSTYNYYPTTDMNQAKIVDFTWKSSRSLCGGLINSENVQTARIVIRKQKVSQ